MSIESTRKAGARLRELGQQHGAAVHELGKLVHLFYFYLRKGINYLDFEAAQPCMSLENLCAFLTSKKAGKRHSICVFWGLCFLREAEHELGELVHLLLFLRRRGKRFRLKLRCFH